jgi:hypothetical protein
MTDHKELVDDLRAFGKLTTNASAHHGQYLSNEAARVIEAQAAEIAALRDALKPFAAIPLGICERDDPALGIDRCSDDTPVYETRHDHGGQTVTAGHFRIARSLIHHAAQGD